MRSYDPFARAVRKKLVSLYSKYFGDYRPERGKKTKKEKRRIARRFARQEPVAKSSTDIGDVIQMKGKR